MAMCHLCKTVRRKAKGESWTKLMCKDCYRLTDHYTHDARWQIASYIHLGEEDLTPTLDLYRSK